MIDLKDLRENPDKYRRGAELKNISVDIAAILDLDAQRLAAQQEFERLRSEQNKASQEIGRLKDPEQKKAAVARMGELKGQVKAAEEKAKAAEAKVMPLLLQVPQVPDADVPVGKDAAQNIIQRKWGEPRKFEFKPKTHIELGESLGLFDTARGVKLAGSRSYFLVGAGAELHNAVLRMAMDLMTREHGFTAMSVPVLVREEAMRGTGFFPAGKEQSYHVQDEIVDGEQRYLYLTGTGEVGLTAFHMDDTLDEAELPKKYTTVSTCFRREAGTYGKDTAGIYRIHQFDKCEQVVICKNDIEESRKWHTTMLGYSEQLLQRLGLPYRVIQCCTGDIGVKNAAMYDLETFMPSRVQNGDIETGYGETHSASRLYEFQARRLNLRYKDKDGKVRFCHTLNNTVVASPRILIPILENYQNADGSVTVPDALRGYMNGRERIGNEK
ncbi:MAG TPA: serine--tRNA ligase [Tepidisphaeraceae bacterium]|jgi:seryl-tRNA synthetase